MTARPRILLVDDNRSLVEALADVFEAKGYDVTSAYDGAQAVDKVRGAEFDCILMDIRMPKLSGVDAFKEIKKLEKSKYDKVAINGFGSAQEAKDEINRGIENYKKSHA